MSFDFKQKMEFENNKKRVMSLFPKDRKVGLNFTYIKDIMGLTSPKTTRLLNGLMNDGFLEKKKVGKKELYFSKLMTYRGSFDIWDLMTKIDKISQKKGRVVKEDLGFLSGLCSVLVYGSLPYEKLTLLEKEMLFQLTNKFRVTFLELSQLIDTINYRKMVEKSMKLPNTCKNIMFGKDSGVVDMEAVKKIYGDALWNYIFNHYTGIFKFQLTKGYMDVHGLKDLFNMLDKAVDSIDVEIKKKGPFGAHGFPQTEVSRKIPVLPRLLFKLNADTIKDNAIGVMITPSPRSLREYSDQVGWIIKHQIELWKNFEYIGKKKKQQTSWADIIETLPTKRKRREWLKIMIVEELLLRYKKLSKVEKKLMIKDSLLNEIFDEPELRKMISKFSNLYSRLMYFYKKKKEGKSLNELKKDSKWFIKEEIEDYKPISDFVFHIDFYQRSRKKHAK